MTAKFNRIHAVCTYLRGIKAGPCLKCPSREKHEHYGYVTKGCYMLAKEACDIAVHGNPWGKRGNDKGIKKWRERVRKGLT